jgi:hypothetical protein
MRLFQIHLGTPGEDAKRVSGFVVEKEMSAGRKKRKPERDNIPVLAEQGSDSGIFP